MTATKKFTQDDISEMQLGAFGKPTTVFDERPQTKAVRRLTAPDFSEEDNKPNLELDDFKPQLRKREIKATASSVKGRIIELNILESWGDMFYVGLNGLQVLDGNGNEVPLDVSNLDANPRDMNSIPGHGADHRTLDKLVNGQNNTTNDMNMWLIPYNAGEDHTVRIDLGRPTTIGAIKFFNYNKSIEDSLRGVK